MGTREGNGRRECEKVIVEIGIRKKEQYQEIFRVSGIVSGKRKKYEKGKQKQQKIIREEYTRSDCQKVVENSRKRKYYKVNMKEEVEEVNKRKVSKKERKTKQDVEQQLGKIRYGRRYYEK